MRNNNAFIIADDKVEEFLKENSDEKHKERIEKIAKRFERHLVEKRISKTISTEEALEDVEPIDWFN